MSQLNRNCSYALSVDGVTPIERLRVTRSFIKDRKGALLKGELGLLQSKEAFDLFLATEEEKRPKFFGHQCDIMAFELAQAAELVQETQQELEYLALQEAALVEAAMPFWNPALTDNENYELNFAREHTVRLVDKAICEQITAGRVSADTMQSLMRNPFAAQMLVDREVLTPEFLKLVADSPVAETTATILIGAGNRFMLPSDHARVLDIYKKSHTPIAAVTNALLALEANKPSKKINNSGISGAFATNDEIVSSVTDSSTVVQFPTTGTAAQTQPKTEA